MSRSFTIYSVYVKKYYQPSAEYLVPIQVGKVLSPLNLLLLGDDTGNNISDQYPQFGELTALYWIWQNAEHKPTDVWGLCHYQRYFSQPKPRIFGAPKMLEHAVASAPTFAGVLCLSLPQDMKQLLKTAGAVVGQHTQLPTPKMSTIDTQATIEVGAEIWGRFKATLNILHPEMEPTTQQFCAGNQLMTHQMMVTTHEFWCAYLGWLFPVLFTVQQNLGSLQPPKPMAVLAFLGERLMNIYLKHHNVKLATMPITVFDKK
jgi:hypothetical protein